MTGYLKWKPVILYEIDSRFTRIPAPPYSEDAMMLMQKRINNHL